MGNAPIRARKGQRAAAQVATLLALLAGCAGKPKQPTADVDLPRAEVAYLEGRYGEALGVLRGAHDPAALDLAGRCQMGMKRYGEAAASFTEALGAGAGTPTRARLAKAYLEDGSASQALLEARRVLESPEAGDAERESLLMTAGTAAARSGAWHEAERWFGRLDTDAGRARLAVVRERTFTVQLGIFRTRDGAASVGEVLEADGIFVAVRGRFPTVEAARAAAGADELAVP